MRRKIISFRDDYEGKTTNLALEDKFWEKGLIHSSDLTKPLNYRKWTHAIVIFLSELRNNFSNF